MTAPQTPARNAHRFALPWLLLAWLLLAWAAAPAALAQSAAAVSGTVTLQGWKGTNEPTPALTFTLVPAGSNPGPFVTVTQTPTPTAAPPCSTFTYTLAGLAPGAYTLAVKGPLWLQAQVSVDASGGSASGANVTLRAGDATGNNVVDSADLGVVRNAYNTVKGGARFNAAADLNGDGVVDSADLGLLRNSYNTVGVPTPPFSLTLSPLAVAGGAPATASLALGAPAPAGGLAFSLSSDSAAATVPAAGVTVPAGASGATFPVTTGAVSAATAAHISASSGGFTATAALTINLASFAGAADVPAPAWAIDVIPTDSSDAPGAGPSSSEDVDLASGVKENTPGPDLVVYNPNGPNVSYSRLYRSALAAKSYNSPGLSPGWVDNYDLSVTASGANYVLNYPNGAQETWMPAGGGAYTPPTGAPYTVAMTSAGFVITYKDNSAQAFAPDTNTAGRYLLAQIADPAGNTVTVLRDPSNGSRVTSVNDSAGDALLSFHYSGNLSTLTDVLGRQITYTFTSGLLTGVSLINNSSLMWSYGYATIGNEPFLNSVQAANPAGTGMSVAATTLYDASGHVMQMTDANGNYRMYSYTGTSATVSAYDSNNNLTQQWTQKFDAMNRDNGITDAANNSTSLSYEDSANPYKVTAATNKNSQQATATFDVYGSLSVLTNLRQINTTHTYDSTFFGLPTKIAVDGKAPVSVSYYKNNTVVNGVTQPNGLIQSLSMPAPGTVNGTAVVTTTYGYTAKGSIAAVSAPAPSTALGGTVTTTYSYTADTQYDGSGNPIPNGGAAYTQPEMLGRPLTVTDGLGLTTHYRYDARGNVITVITPLGERTDSAYDAANDPLRVMYPATNPATPNARASTAYTYYYLGGPLETVTEYDEGGNPVRQSNFNNGSEGEAKQQTGEVDEQTYAYDGRYRPTTLSDGNGQPAKNTSYDAVGNPQRLTYALGDGPQFTRYDPAGNLSQAMNGRGTAVGIARAADDSRPTDVTYGDGVTPAVHIGTAGSGYDVYDRVLHMIDGAGTTDATYDDDDDILTQTVTYAAPGGAGTLPPATLTYTYNDDGSLASLSTPRVLSNGAYAYWTFQYKYDNDGRMTDVVCPWTSSPTGGSQADINYTYDNDGRLVKTHTARTDTFYVFNARGFLTELQEANGYSSSLFNDPPDTENGQTGHPNYGTILNNFTPVVTPGGTTITGDVGRLLLADYQMQYDALGNRTQNAVSIPDLYQYDSNENYLYRTPGAPDVDGTLFYLYDGKDRPIGETTYNASNVNTMEDYALGNGSYFYNYVFSYPFAFDAADAPQTVRGNAQTFNHDNQLTTESYDGDGDQTSWQGATLGYDAASRTTAISGLNNTLYSGTVTFGYNGAGLRAWKQTSAGTTYSLYAADGTLVCELDRSGNPTSTFAHGADGLAERYKHGSGVGYVNYVYDPDGSVVHRVYGVDPALTSGDAVFAHDTVLYDRAGLLHADIDPITANVFGGFAKNAVDMVGSGGQWGLYTDVETLTDPRAGTAAAGTYLSPIGPGGSAMFNPASGVAMARAAADSADEYAAQAGQAWGDFRGGAVGLAGLAGGAFGANAGAALCAGGMDAYLTRLEGGSYKDAARAGAETGAVTFAFGKAAEGVTLVGARGVAALARAVSRSTPAAEAAGAVTKAAVSNDAASAGLNCFVAGTLVQAPDGARPIEQVRVGDEVVSRDPQTGVTEPKRVTATFSHTAPQVLTLTLTDAQGQPSQSLTCTPGHPFYVAGVGFVLAGDLGIGTQIVTRAGPPVTVVGVQWHWDADGAPQGARVYNLTVQGDHTYFVGGLGGGAWVHNDSYVYRGVSMSELEKIDAGEGLTAKNPSNILATPAQHVNNLKETPFISTSKSDMVALLKYGPGLVRVNLTKVRASGADIFDISGGIPGASVKANAFAKNDLEVLIRSHIPPDAIEVLDRGH